MRTLGYLILAIVATACRQNTRRSDPEGHMEVEWKGRAQGGISAPATAAWCTLRPVLEIRAVRGDTGVALALYPNRTLGSGPYRVVDPVKAESVPPAAGVAVRWLGQNAVQGFQGDSGQVDLQRSSSGRLSGRVRARARSVVDTQRITLTGTFRDVALRPDSVGCAPPHSQDEDAEAVDTGVH